MINLKYSAEIFLMSLMITNPVHMQTETQQAEDCFTTWTSLPDLPDSLGLSGTFCGISNGAMILAGGSNFDRPQWEGGQKIYHDEIYVLEKKDTGYQWHMAGRLPFPVAHGTSVSTPEGLLCMGGADGHREFDKVFNLSWDPVVRKVLIDQEYSNLPEPCAYLSATLTGKQVYVAGGLHYMTTGKEMKNFWRLQWDHPLDNWEILPAWPGPARFGAILASVENSKGSFLVMCSGKSGEKYLQDTYQFRLTGQPPHWELKASMPEPALLASSTAIGNMLFVFSGSDGHDIDRINTIKSGYHFSNIILGYNTEQNRWAIAGNMPVGVVNTSVIQWNGRLVIPGGEIHPSIRTVNVQVTDIPAKISECHCSGQ